MTKKPKKFDCVEMKWSIQKKIEQEFKGVPEDEAKKIQREQINKNPILGPFLVKVPQIHMGRSVARKAM